MTENLTGENCWDGLIKRYEKRKVLKGVSLNAKPGKLLAYLDPMVRARQPLFRFWQDLLCPMRVPCVWEKLI